MSIEQRLKIWNIYRSPSNFVSTRNLILHEELHYCTLKRELDSNKQLEDENEEHDTWNRNADG